MASGRRKDARASSARAGRRPLLERPGLVLWLLAADAVLVPVVWLILQKQAWQAALVHVALFSGATFLLFALDKLRARRKKRRVSEANLLLLSTAGGALGGLLGMAAFRHKTRPLRFRILLPAALLVHVAAVIVLSFEGF